MNKSYTCPVCETKVEAIPDGKIKLCKCKKMAIDCTNEYTRFVGHVPKKSPSFDQWYAQYEPIIKALKENYYNEMQKNS